MTALKRTAFVLVVSLSLILTGCGAGNKSALKQGPPCVVTRIAILPAVAALDYDNGPVSPQQTKSLNQGVRTMNALLRQKFEGRRGFRLVSADQISGFTGTLPLKALALARMVGGKVGCNAVLQTTVRRYRERVGGKYTAEEPAAVAFEIRLIEVDNGRIICDGKYDEVQQSLLENLFALAKAKQRKFSWVTAADLMRDGLNDKLSSCSCLADMLKK